MHIEEFVLTFKRLKDPNSPLPYNVITKHSRIPVIGGLFQSQASEPFSADQLHAIQQEYMTQLEVAHSIQIDSGEIADLPPKNALYDFGNRVARLLPTATRRSLAQAIGRTHRTKQYLRIVFNLYPDVLELLAVPWELITTSLDLEDSATAELNQIDQLVERDFLLQNPMISLVRQIHGVGVQTNNIIAHPFPVEAMLAQPMGVSPIVNQELIEGLFEPEHYFDGDASLETLLQRMQQYQPSVVHVVAHGGHVNREAGLSRYDLLLTKQDGFARRVGAADLAPILANSSKLQLVVLHACYAATQSQAVADPNSESTQPIDQQRTAVEGVALGLIRRGIPFVVAFQGEVRQDAAAIFSKVLYQQLDRGIPLEFAVTQARLAIIATIPAGVVDWSLPVVYRGAIVNNPQANYDTLGDRFHRWTESSRFIQWLRSIWVLFGLIAMMIAFVIPFYYTNASLLNIADSTMITLNLLSRLGVIIPAILALFYRPYFQPSYMEPSTKRFLRITKFMGAYCGYGLSYSLIIGLYICNFIIFGELIGQKPYNYILTIVLGIFNIFLCNIFMRNFTQSFWGLSIYNSIGEKILEFSVVGGISILSLFIFPLMINYAFNDRGFHFLLLTPVLAMIMAIATLFMVLSMMEEA